MQPGYVLIIVAFLLAIIALVLRQRRPDVRELVEQASPSQTSEFSLRPTVAEMHVRDDRAIVRFDVAYPDEPDEVLTEILATEAVEVIREKKHSLPMAQVHKIVVQVGAAGSEREITIVELPEIGALPERPNVGSLLNLSHIAGDPLDKQFEHEVEDIPEVVEKRRDDALGSISGELRLPKAIETGLRAQGIDPAEMSAFELVTGMLSLFGYQLTSGPDGTTVTARKGAAVTFIRNDPYVKGDHPEVAEEAVDKFMHEFAALPAERGLYVSDKYGPFSVYEKERRQPAVRFITRERLQAFLDGLALS